MSHSNRIIGLGFTTFFDLEINDAKIEMLFNDLHFAGVCFVIAVLMNFAMVIVGFLKNDANGRYFFMHFLFNMYVTYAAIGDVIKAYSDPFNSHLGQSNNLPLMAILALHVYHIVCYQPLPMVDWVHHIVMVVLALPVAYLLQPGPLLCHGTFFVSGLPGGLDYLMLVLVKLGYMESITEKTINQEIQSWMRMPGCLMHAFLGYSTYSRTKEMIKSNTLQTIMPVNLSFIPRYNTALLSFCAWFIILSYFWNGIYFQVRVVANTAVKLFEMQDKKKKA